jgi:hypothetical protein
MLAVEYYGRVMGCFLSAQQETKHSCPCLRPLETVGSLKGLMQPPRNGDCCMDIIPDEMIYEIFRFLCAADLAAVGRACVRFHGLAEDILLWKDLCQTQFQLVKGEKLTKEELASWKVEYLEESAIGRIHTKEDDAQPNDSKQSKESKEIPVTKHRENRVQGDPEDEEEEEETDSQKEKENKKKCEQVKTTPIEWSAVNWKRVFRALKGLCWDSKKSDVGITSSSSGCTSTHPYIAYATTQSKQTIRDGTHFFSVRVDSIEGGGVGIGVCPIALRSRAHVKPFCGDVSTTGYSYFSNGCKYNRGSFYTYRYETFGAGDIISVLLDMNKRTVNFFKNGKSLGVGFDELPEQVTLGISLSKSQVSLLPLYSLMTSSAALEAQQPAATQC